MRPADWTVLDCATPSARATAGAPGGPVVIRPDPRLQLALAIASAQVIAVLLDLNARRPLRTDPLTGAE